MQYGLPANPHTLAFCDEHKKDLGMIDGDLVLISQLPALPERIQAQHEPKPLHIWGGQ